jgi:MFS transporter, NHS family, xanthosine permease
MFWVMLLNCMFYMPTISMANTVSYSIMESRGFNIIKEFPPIRVWGTIGFIIAMWTVSLNHWELSKIQLYIASVSSLFLGIYSFTLPACPPEGKSTGGSFFSAMGLDALVLFKKTKMAMFFLFSMALGVCLQITNSFADGYIHSFSQNPLFHDALAVKFPAIIISISQMSETVFILTIPFFLRKFGIKTVMIMSMLAWFFRFALLGLGDPGNGLWLFIVSMIVYWMAFDFFNISGSLYVEMEAEPKFRASAQGLFMIMTNGIGGFIGSLGAGKIIDTFTSTAADGSKNTNWSTCWYIFAGYALVLALIFIPLFKYKHDPKALEAQAVKH